MHDYSGISHFNVLELFKIETNKMIKAVSKF